LEETITIRYFGFGAWARGVFCGCEDAHFELTCLRGINGFSCCEIGIKLKKFTITDLIWSEGRKDQSGVLSRIAKYLQVNCIVPGNEARHFTIGPIIPID